MSETLKFKNCPQCKALLSQKNYPNFCPSCGQDLIAAAKDLEGILARIPESARTPVKRSFPWYWLLPIGLVVLMIIAAIASIQTPINPVSTTAIRPTLASIQPPINPVPPEFLTWSKFLVIYE
jgi:hypothetical protein